ncbi:hypothetical protein PWO45_20350 [Bacillus amyloliquefaciens]|uniref:hypothetical protein n=1 Tax=Bacteria TaxID=2 RepID=UPI000D0B5E49|nr:MULTISPECIES: hypothetical protein [Bacillus amyloliquefaciens group]MDE5156305.1 hypothetical protein [Bacillus amyloliquefaciens]QRL09364.1 hypothetical protein GKO36_10745 [Bacillus velezensis]
MGYATRPTVKAPKVPKKEPVNPNEFASLMQKGVLTINEVRGYHGLSSINGGDSVLFNGRSMGDNK